MSSMKTSQELLDFLETCPTSFHTIHKMKQMLEGNGFQQLKENTKWEIRLGGNYYVTRNDSSLIAISIPLHPKQGYRIIASHSDSPCFKIKENPEMSVDGKYIKLNVERYGGMICSSWFDRPLSVAGRVIVKENGELKSKLVSIDRDLVMIVNQAIHMDREINNGHKYNAQKDMLPLYGSIEAEGSFLQQIAETAQIREEDILGHDLFLYNRQKGSIWGAKEEYISCGRLDDLQCVYGSLQGFLQGEKTQHIALHCVFDNEEVGSGTKQGAASTFLYDTLTRINGSLGLSQEDYLMHLADSFMISADNAHALHPNYEENMDPKNKPVINGGIVIKYNANQKYCTDAVSAAMFKDLCQSAGVPVQTFVNRSDMAGGSTLGNIANTQVSIRTVDIGLPQLAMHSSYETAGIKDTESLIRAFTAFFE